MCVGSTVCDSLGGVEDSYAVLKVEAEKDEAKEEEDNFDRRLGRNALGGGVVDISACVLICPKPPK